MSAAAIRLSETTWIRTVEIFGVFARRGVEGGCLWYGDRQMGVVEIIGVPRQINRERNFEIRSDALAELNLRVPDEVSVLAQLHAHPGRRVRQSRWDDQMIVSRNIILSTYTDAHIHLQHISSRNAVEILRRAKTRGVKITAEAIGKATGKSDD